MVLAVGRTGIAALFPIIIVVVAAVRGFLLLLLLLFVAWRVCLTWFLLEDCCRKHSVLLLLNASNFQKFYLASSHVEFLLINFTPKKCHVVRRT